MHKKNMKPAEVGSWHLRKEAVSIKAQGEAKADAEAIACCPEDLPGL